MEAVVVPLLLAPVLAVIFLAIFRPSTRNPIISPVQTRRTTVVVSDPSIVRLMLIDHADAFSNRPMAHFPEDFNGTHSINTIPYGPTWRALRGNLTADIFHPTRLGLLAHLQRDAVETLVTGLSAHIFTGEAITVAVRDHLHAAVFGLTVRLCFGDGVSDRAVRAMEHEVRQFVFTFVEDSALLARSWLPRLLHRRRWLRYSGTFNRLSKLILPLICARQQSRHAGNNGRGTGFRCYVDSLLDLLVPENDDDATAGKKRPLTDKEMVRLVFEFLGANTESIVSCVEWTLAHLVTNPDIQRKLHGEIATDRDKNKGAVISEERLRGLPYLRAVILESLRLHAPVPLIMRDASAHDAAVCGALPTPADDGTSAVRVIVKVRDVGRSRKAWTDPDGFRPERFLAGGEAKGVGPVPGPKEIRMAPFGAGRRYCPGVGIGMVHVASFLAAPAGVRVGAAGGWKQH